MSDKIIVMNRGDSYNFVLAVYDDDDQIYFLHPEDKLYFGLMDPHQHFEDALVKKRYTKDDFDDDGYVTITLKSSDTLDLFPGVYYYAVKLHRVSTSDNIDEVVTIINKNKLVLND